MRALDVSVNGRHVCVAGIGCGVLAAHVTRTGDEHTEFISFSVIGLEGDTYHQWLVPSIGVGDDVTIRVVEVPTADPPTTSEVSIPYQN